MDQAQAMEMGGFPLYKRTARIYPVNIINISEIFQPSAH